MKVSVYSLKKTLFEGEAESVNCKTAAGEITILDHHRPLITSLTQGVMTIRTEDGKESFLSVTGGFLEVTNENQARFIVDEAS